MSNLSRKRVFPVMAAAVLFTVNICLAENIDPNDDGSQYAYGENVGWVNFEPNIPGPNVGATVSDANVTGFVWAENIGWINLDPNDADANTGVSNDGTGLLSGLAWGENVGWIKFDPNVPCDPNHYGVTIDHDGNFNGWAWGENIGWIHLSSDSPVAYRVRTLWITSCEVGYDDLKKFVQDWVQSGGEFPGDLDDDGDVDFDDYTVISGLWLELCPAGWPLQ